MVVGQEVGDFIQASVKVVGEGAHAYRLTTLPQYVRGHADFCLRTLSPIWPIPTLCHTFPAILPVLKASEID